jgi:endo-1,4-beta-mannosidase
MYLDWARSDVDELTLPFLGLVTSWLGRGKDVLFEEFGASATGKGSAHSSRVRILGEDEAAGYTERALKALLGFGFKGAMVWCFTDYAEQLWEMAPLDRATHERFFGLFRADGSAKPVVEKIKQFTDAPRRELCRDTSWIDIRVEDYYKAPASNLRRLYRNFVRCYG